MINSSLLPFDSAGLFSILLQKENGRLETAVLGNGLWSPGGKIVSRQCVLLVWVPCCQISGVHTRC